MKRLSLELGGHAAFIVCPMPTPRLRPRRCERQVSQHGPVVHCAEPILRAQRRAEEIHRGRSGVHQALKLGNGLDPSVEVGPMFEKKALQSTIDLVADACKTGAKVLTGGKRSDASKGATFLSRPCWEV